MANEFYTEAILEMAQDLGLKWGDNGEWAFDLYGIDTAFYSFDPSHQELGEIPPVARHPAFRLNTFILLFTNAITASNVSTYPFDPAKDLNAFVIVREQQSTGGTRLIAYIDTAPGLPVLVADGAERIDVQWNLGGVFQFT